MSEIIMLLSPEELVVGCWSTGGLEGRETAFGCGGTSLDPVVVDA